MHLARSETWVCRGQQGLISLSPGSETMCSYQRCGSSSAAAGIITLPLKITVFHYNFQLVYSFQLDVTVSYPRFILFVF